MDTKFDKSVTNNESGVLAKLWRKIISENNLLPQIGMLINKYLDEDETNQRVQAYKKKNRSTLTENIFASEMSIKVFLYLIFKVLRAKKIDISIKVKFLLDENPCITFLLMAAVPEEVWEILIL